MDTPSIKRENRLAVFEHVVQKKKRPRKRFSTNRFMEDSSQSESELLMEDDEPQPVRKKQKVSVKLSEEPLSLECKWQDCQFRTSNYEKFNGHIIEHASSEEEDELRCYWDECSYTAPSLYNLSQHLSYHGYLSKLINIGNNVLLRNTLPECKLLPDTEIPIQSSTFKCDWEYCENDFVTVYDFFWHMNIHVKNNPKVCAKGETILCEWLGCESKFSSQYKLAEHLRVHTKEKIIACPTCYKLFASKTKFCDHRKRQLEIDLQSYQCSQCLKLFPSERLLRDHMRSHINHYKCNMCDMTCPKPSILAKHIRYKHVKERLFKCPYCDSKFVAKNNLTTHLFTHSAEKKFACEECDFKCRSSYGLENHYVKVHRQDVAQVYECHCCYKTFGRGGVLTKHLMKVHNFHWPSGHSRFRYKQDQDGIFRLQTVRYESLEVTQEMIRSESLQASSACRNVTKTEDSEYSYVLNPDPNNSLRSLPVIDTSNDIVITLDDVDEHGNIINSKVVQTKAEILDQSSSEEEQKNVPLCRSELILESEDAQSSDFSNQVIKSEMKGENGDIHYFSKDIILNCDKFKIQGK